MAGCTLAKQDAPALTGPSELGMSLEVTATPDFINWDGQSRSTIQVLARNANSQPISGLTMRVEIAANGQLVDFGAISSRTISTGGDGRASVTYTAEAAPPVGAGSVRVTILLTPIGTNYANAVKRAVEIWVSPPGQVIPPNGAPKPSFFYSPAQPRAGDDVNFDASASTDEDGQIVSYLWDFGDGRTGTGMRAVHSYELAGTYRVTLTAVDNQGLRASTVPVDVTVGTSTNPVANFTVSPAPGVSGRDVFFSGALSTAVDGRSIVNYRWDFGDAVGPERFAEGLTVAHIYGKAGTYNVVLTVTDDTGRTGSASKTVTIADPSEH